MKTTWLLLVYTGFASERYQPVALHLRDSSCKDGNVFYDGVATPEPSVWTKREDAEYSEDAENDYTPEFQTDGSPYGSGVFAVGGYTSFIAESPWHVGVYWTSKPGIYEHLCGGTLISTTIVISAAHCFYDEQTTRLYDVSLYMIGLGKNNRSWTEEDDGIQRRGVAALHVPRRYRGVKGHYGYDIALVVLSSAVEVRWGRVVPIAIDWNNELQFDSEGYATGWGKLYDGTSSETLQTVILPYVPENTCFDALSDYAKNFLTPDKICAGYQDKNTSVCQGDSGGGITFRHRCNWRLYLLGITSVSFKPAHNNDPCFAQLYTGFTQISWHIRWIKENVDIKTIEMNPYLPYGCIKEKLTTAATRQKLKSVKMCRTFANVVGSDQDVRPTRATATCPQEFPHMAAIGTGDVTGANTTWICDGSLISERYVLTAAHCFDVRKRGTHYWVRLGERNSAQPSFGAVTVRHQLIEVAERIRHFLYTPSTFYHDIALVKLKEAVVFNAFVRPACLDWEPPRPGGTYTLSGFGRDSFDSERREQLMKGDVELYGAAACNITYSQLGHSLIKLPTGFDDNTMMCFRPFDIKTDCVAVGGAPVQKILHDAPCLYSIVGVTSFGPGPCGTIHKPFVTTRVYFYRTWIESIVWPELDFTLATHTNYPT